MGNEIVKKNTWVEIFSVVLKPGERSKKIPEDTQNVPLELKARGFLIDDAAIGDDVMIKTIIGRKLSGKLIESNPGFTHSFGEPISELLTIGNELREMIRN